MAVRQEEWARLRALEVLGREYGRNETWVRGEWDDGADPAEARERLAALASDQREREQAVVPHPDGAVTGAAAVEYLTRVFFDRADVAATVQQSRLPIVHRGPASGALARTAGPRGTGGGSVDGLERVASREKRVVDGGRAGRAGGGRLGRGVTGLGPRRRGARFDRPDHPVRLAAVRAVLAGGHDGAPESGHAKPALVARGLGCEHERSSAGGRRATPSRTAAAAGGGSSISRSTTPGARFCACRWNAS